MKGTVAKFNAKRGFGFIRSDQLDDEIFVHITKVDGRRALRPGQDVTFDAEQTDKGLAAVNVVVQDGQVNSIHEESSDSGSSIMLIVIAVIIVIGVTAAWYFL